MRNNNGGNFIEYSTYGIRSAAGSYPRQTHQHRRGHLHCGEFDTNYPRCAGRRTRLTMTGKFYENVAAKYGIQIFTPNGDDQAYIHNIYINELVNNIIKPETKSRLIEIIKSISKKYQLEGVILGGTDFH